MNNNNNYLTRFYQHIDSPMMLFIIEADEFLVGVTVFFGLMIGTMLAGVVIGGMSFFYLIIAIFVTYYYGKYKRNKPSGYTFQVLYRLGYFHPTDIPRRRKSMKSKTDFQVLPSYYTTRLMGQ